MPVDQSKYTDAEDDAQWEAVKNIEHFYDKLKPMPGALELFNALNKEYDCEILTKIPKKRRGIECAGEDKIKWVHRLISEDIKVIVVQDDPKKNYCKGKGYILIDDFEGNINDWDNAGGTGIRFTTPEAARRKIQECEKF